MRSRCGPSLPANRSSFPLIDVQQAERPGQLAQVIGGWSDQQQAPVWPQDAAQLGAVARSEHVQHQAGGGVGDRQWAPRVAADGADSPMGPCRRPERVPGDIQGHPGVPGEPGEHRGEVVAGPGADVDHAAAAQEGDRRGGRVGQRGGDRGEMSGNEKLAAGAHHRGRIPGPAGHPGLKQAYVALPGDVKVVPGRASERAASPRQAGPAVRAPQIADNVVKHACLHAVAFGGDRRPPGDN